MDPQTPFQPQVLDDQSAFNAPTASLTPIETPVAPQAPGADLRAQITDRIKGGKNVLVTVGSNPSVDELASALGLTLLLGKLDKHVTAVFSGEIPPAIEFLDPEATFENTVDSLRDFIIALDKEKADKLRYKVEDEFVKIFITPYKTVINEKDLQFSQGDFNVDIVLALGVEKREELDSAITAHGRILHDAVVITINSGLQKSNLGSIDWNDPEASSVAEMLISLSTGFGPEILDAQISTAFLTGIVAETNRFSNEKTSPKVMTMAAQLMASGANQQLIATNLRHEGMISEPVRSKDEQAHDDNGEMVLEHESDKETDSKSSKDKKDTKDDTSTPAKPKEGVETKDTTTENTDIVAESDQSNKPEKSKETKSKSTSSEEPVSASAKNDAAKDQLKAALDKAAGAIPDKSESQTETSKRDFLEISKPTTEVDTLSLPPEEDKPSVTDGLETVTETPAFEPITAHQPKVVQPLSTNPLDFKDTISTSPQITPMPTPSVIDAPTFGGTLNATTATAEEEKAEQAEREASVNNIALNHDGGSEPANNEAVEAARRAVEDAAVSQPFNPANNPLAGINSQELPISHAITPDATVSSMQKPKPQSFIPISTEPSQNATEPSPVDAFMQPQADPNALNSSFVAQPQQQFGSPIASQPSNLPGQLEPNGLPPLPPMPTTNGGALPPLPPLPGQAIDPSTVGQPQINPAFMQDMPQSQNPWTDAAQANTARQEENQANRDQRMQQMNQQYNTAVDRNRELQGLPPLNDPNGSGFPPVTPQ